jgi:Domain of unknown function (DUF4340)
MSPRQLVRLALVLAAAIVLWGILAIARRPPADAVKTLAIPKVDTAAVDTVVLTRRSDTARLVRVARGPWRVNGYPAALDAVTGLLRALADTTGWSEQVAEHRASQERFGVGADSGQRVQVITHGRTVIDVVTGARTADYGGLYMRRTGDDAVYAVHGGLADAVNRSISDWRDKHIASVAPDSVVTVTIDRGARMYTLRRGRQGWRFDSGAPADSAAVASLLSQYRDLNAVGFATPAEADSATFARARRGVRLVRGDGTAIVGLRFDSTSSHVWARADSGGPVYQLSSWTLGQLTPPDSTLKPRPAPKQK